MADILADLGDLYKQATEERSHYYTGACIRRAMTEIAALRVACERLRGAVNGSREAALEDAARIAENGCLVPPDGGSPTEDELQMCNNIAFAIRLLKGVQA
ncbi:hypothetical protein [Bradyrhizobium sp. 33ap4]|uniref:hypothetical protein n=1 Tax=Bradyrhizobium sp. 33ap4 TaxID=3061630 RepID=UPI00292ECD6E|nr:hypothetical protein [Bradyrhizobium sp. 33ap4]